MRPAQTIQLAAQPLEAIFTGKAPVDFELNQLFKSRGSGPRERALIGDLIFLVLRHRRRLTAYLSAAAPNRSPGPLELIATALTEQEGWEMRQLCALLNEPPPPSIPPITLPLTPAETFSLPEWLWEAFVAQWGETESQQLGQALLQPAPTDLRVNTLCTDREKVALALAKEGITTTPLTFAPHGLRLHHNAPLTTLPLFRQGGFEIQDAGSQLISLLLAPRPKETVIDLCAGAGGKTLHLAALMNNQGRLIAADSDPQRLSRLSPRMRRAGVRIIRTLAIRHEGDPLLRPFTGKADAVLIDAPCSGTGTLRRRPEIKWRTTPEEITGFHQRQCALLAAGARLTRPGGRLVYATCSLLKQENQMVAETFLRENPEFRLIPAMQTLAAQGVHGLHLNNPFLMLLPHAASCDGFFAALFQRNR